MSDDALHSPASGGDLSPDTLTAAVRAWRKRAGVSAATAAQMLGLPVRTLEGVEQGRGFRYPRLLMLALEAGRDDSTEPTTPR